MASPSTVGGKIVIHDLCISGRGKVDESHANRKQGTCIVKEKRQAHDW
jgi:hypothetical protein